MLRIRRESSRFRSPLCIHEAAAVRRHVAIGGVGTAWRPGLGKVWEVPRTQPGLRADGHNVFLYHHPARCDLAMRTSALKSHARLNPLGKFTPPRLRRAWLRLQCMWASTTASRKPTTRFIYGARRANWAFAGKSWEIYGDWSEDPSKLETTIMYMLK